MKKPLGISFEIQPGRTLETFRQMPEAIRAFLTDLPAVIYECGPPPSFPTTFVSDNVHAQFGYKPEEFYADPFFWTKRIHENDRSHVLGRLASIGDEHVVTYEYRFRRRTGEYVWLHDQVSVLRNDDRSIVGLVGSSFNISDRKRLEMLQSAQAQILDCLVQRRSLEESLEQIVRMLESQNPDMICSILRFDATTQTLRHGAAPNLPEEYNRRIDGVRIGPAAGSCGTAAYRRERVVVTDIRSDPLWADYRDSAALIDMRACWSQPILSSSNQLLGTFAMYYRNPRGPAKEELVFIEQAAGLAALAIERFHDEETMRHAERLVSLGTLAAGIAHEVNNPLGGIQLAVQNATAALAQGRTDQVQSMLDLIARGTERCARIVRGVLQFGRRTESHKQPANLNQILKAACQLMNGYAAKRKAVVELSPASSDIEILGDTVELEQVFVNLIRNAVESKDKGAHITIRVAIDQDFARVTVSDDGRGMTNEQKSRIFDPFFTTRHAEGGTGLGMSIVHGIVIGHGGTIRVESTPNTGTSVVVCLPRHP